MNTRTDPQRPRIHFLPSLGWINDPNGLIEYAGRTHLFYQYNPHGNAWNAIHWGHASSADLIHWQHHPLALAPQPGGLDADGVFSGCAVLDGETPTLLYTAHRWGPDGSEWQVQCLATSDGALLAWRRDPANPVLEPQSCPLPLTGFRDPSVWREADGWHLALGAGFERGPGTVLHYHSNDLRTWSSLGELLRGTLEPHHGPDPLAAPGLQNRYAFWECPSVFRLGQQMVLLLSRLPERDVYSFVGDFDGLRLHPRAQGPFCAGLFYAPQVYRDARGRSVCFGWIPEDSEGGWAAPRPESAWTGAMSLPRVLDLERGRLVQNPAPELEALRRGPPFEARLELSAGSEHHLPLEGDLLELELDLEAGDGVLLSVRCSPDGQEWTGIRLEGHTLSVQRTHSSARPAAAAVVPHTLTLEPGSPLRFRLFLDASVLELFADGQALVSRIYPSRSDSLGLRLSARAAARVGLRVWALEEATFSGESHSGPI